MTTTKRQPKKGSVERQVGFAGRFIVYYTRNGKKYWDAIYAPTAEQTKADFLAACAELGWKVSDVTVKVREVAAQRER